MPTGNADFGCQYHDSDTYYANGNFDKLDEADNTFLYNTFVNKPSIKGAFYSTGVKVYNKTSRIIRRQFGDMNDPTTIPHNFRNGQIGGASTHIDVYPSLRGNLDMSSGNAPDPSGSHENTTFCPNDEQYQYDPFVEHIEKNRPKSKYDEYFGHDQPKQKSWSLFNIPNNIPRFRRKFKKKNKTYCM